MTKVKAEKKKAKKAEKAEIAVPKAVAKKLPKVGETFSLTEKQVLDIIKAHKEEGLLTKYQQVCIAKGEFQKGDLLHSELPKIRPSFADSTSAGALDSKAALILLSHFFSQGHLAVSLRAIVGLIEKRTGLAGVELKASQAGDTGAFKIRQGLHRISKSDTDEKRVRKDGTLVDSFGKGGKLWALKTDSISYKGGMFFPMWSIEYVNPVEADLDWACTQAIRGLF